MNRSDGVASGFAPGTWRGGHYNFCGVAESHIVS
jgi:hypothetical protein